MTRHALLLAGLAVGLLLAVSADAQPPVVEAGDCLYLVGAPPGAPAAETEQRTESSRIHDVCTIPAQVDLNRDGENMIQAWLLTDFGLGPNDRSCMVSAAVGHEFQVPEGLPSGTRAWVSVTASAVALLESAGAGGGLDPSRLVLSARVRETGAASPKHLVSERVLLETSVSVTESRLLDERLGATISFLPRPGATYAVELALELDGRFLLVQLDAGTPGSGRQVSYDRIEVCLAAPETTAGGAEQDLEHHLYLRDCYPGLYLPNAFGGSLEDARALVATRVTQSEAAGTRSAKIASARKGLVRADAATDDGDHAAACRALAQSLHALTTP